MFAPNALVATSPSPLIAEAISRVVVVLPFVALSRTRLRSEASRVSSSGSSLSPILPPMTDPSPRPASRDILDAVRPSATASCDRSGRSLIGSQFLSDVSSELSAFRCSEAHDEAQVPCVTQAAKAEVSALRSLPGNRQGTIGVLQ